MLRGRAEGIGGTEKMEEITLCHLFPKLMSLYGGYGNIVVLKRLLEENGCSVTVKNADEPPFFEQKYDFVYLGSGTDIALRAAAKIIAPFSAEVRKSIESGTPWLLTGDALGLLADTSLYENGECVFPEINAKKLSDKRYLGDVLTDGDNIFGAPCVGFVNTRYDFDKCGGFCTDLFNLRRLHGQKKEASAKEGFKYKNMFSMRITGPVLAKNPHMLAYFAAAIAGKEISVPQDSDIAKAYEITRAELTARAYGRNK